MSFRWYIIINPVAGNGLGKKKVHLLTSFLDKQGFLYELAYTTFKGHAISLAQQAVGQGYRHIIAAGGDGTANEVANGIMLQQAVPSHEVTFALFPVGTGNDWILTHRIPPQPEKWFAMLLQQKTTLQDVGLVKCRFGGQERERYFINVAGMAYDAYVVEQIENAHVKASNKFRYMWWILKCLFKYKLPHGTLSFNNLQVKELFYTINAGICRYSGGGMQFVPHAIPDDGLLALTYAKKVSKIDLIINTPRFYSGTIVRHRQLATAQTKHITVEASEGSQILIETDGELIGEAPVEISILENALRIVVNG